MPFTSKEGLAAVVALDVSQLGPALDVLEDVRILQLLLTLVHKLYTNNNNNNKYF